jgi:hypothetical protein
MPIPRGASRERRPARNHGMRDVRVEPPAGLPGLLTPRRGPRSAARAFGQSIPDPMAPLPIPSGTPGLGAARARSRAEHLPTLAAPRRQWRPRVPATRSDAPAVLAQAAPQTMAPLTEGSRSHGGRARDGGGAPRGGRIHAAPHPPQAPRPGDTPRLQPRAPAVHASPPLGRTACACAADAPPALGRPWPRAGRPPACSRAPSALCHAMPREGAQSTARPLTKACLRSTAPGPGGSQPSRPSGTHPGGASSPPMHATPPSSPRRNGAPARPAKPARHGGGASCQPHSCWRPRGRSQRLRASWRC